MLPRGEFQATNGSFAWLYGPVTRAVSSGMKRTYSRDARPLVHSPQIRCEPPDECERYPKVRLNCCTCEGSLPSIRSALTAQASGLMVAPAGRANLAQRCANYGVTARQG